MLPSAFSASGRMIQDTESCVMVMLLANDPASKMVKDCTRGGPVNVRATDNRGDPTAEIAIDP
jgi:hypothetical protein